ncbi:MAG: histidinol dehydrogenase [Eggerthella lenta]
MGGAQAIAALAYGTESIAPVAKITGPATPTWRRREGGVGRCGIDMIARPRCASWPFHGRSGARPSTSWRRPSTTRWPPAGVRCGLRRRGGAHG